MHRPALSQENPSIVEVHHVTVTHRWATAGILALVAFGGLAVRAQEGVVARVDGKTITEADMRLAEAEIGSDLGSLPEGTKRRVLVEFLIENQLFADAAEKQKLSAGTGFDERMQYWRRRALRDVYFDKSVKDTLSDVETKRFYDQQVGTLKPEDELRARHILVESRDKARDLFQKILHGADFATLAREHSKDPGSKDQGGELGFFSRGQMVPQFEEAAFKLKAGEVGEPFETQFGWHIVKVDERRQRTAPAFEDVKDRVRASMMHQKAQQIASELRGKAQIEYIDQDIRKSVERDRTPSLPKQ
jgi:peptidyl-prolyl cis-trans isomerase C